MTCSEREVGSETGVCAASMTRRAVWRVGRRCQSSINSRRRFREASIPSPFSVVSARRKRVATTTGVCPTPPIDRSIDRGDCRFRVHRGSHSIPFRARRFRDRFSVSPTVWGSKTRRRWPFSPEQFAVGLGGCLRASLDTKNAWRVIVPPVIRRSRAHRGHTPRASPSLRDPHATGSGRASVRGSSGSRTARAESSRRFDKLEADCASRRRRGSPRRTSRHASVHGAAVRRRA